jgi:hypothetical protein
MRIACFLNTSGSINWGCQATFEGVRYLLQRDYPQAGFVPFDLPPAPRRMFRQLRRFHERKLGNAIISNDAAGVRRWLARLGLAPELLDGFTHICFNGEGAVHFRSGHLLRCMGLLYLLAPDRRVAAVNQTIDLGNDPWLEQVVACVYNRIDTVAVREPVSLRYAQRAGIRNVRLIPDAVYGLPRMTPAQITALVEARDLPEHYITLTGSSALRPDRQSLRRMRTVITSIRACSDHPFVFMASAKTDLWLAARLAKDGLVRVIGPEVKYRDAMAIIARSGLLVGGRQHPNIFAWIYGTPYLPFAGNTFKNAGVAELQQYPVKPLSWDATPGEIAQAWTQAASLRGTEFPHITVDDFRIF